MTDYINLLAFGRVTNGQLKISQRDLFLQDLASFEGKEIQLTISLRTKKRTLKQNAYLHFMISIFTHKLNELGNKFKVSLVKDMLKYKFLKMEIYDTETGELMGVRIKDTSELSTKEMGVFIDDILQYAAEEYGILLPHPEEQLRIELK